MTDRPGDPGMTSGEPPTAPPPFPPMTGPVDVGAETAVRSGGVAGRVVAGAIGAVLLVGGVAFAATQAGGDGGAEDPVAAVREMFDAVADEDVLGLLATLDPDERDAIAGPVEELFDELKRLEVLDESFELDGVAGIDLEFDDLAFRTEEVRKDLVRVHLTGGTASYAMNTDEIPVGDFLVDTFDRFGVEYQGVRESGSDTLASEDIAQPFLVARDTGDGWAVSLGYTAAEVVRERMGAPVPAVGGGLAPLGADSPTAAVEGFLRAAVAIDVEGVVARLSPGEFGALHDYWAVLVDQADLPTAADVDADIELTDLELRATTGDRRAQVFIDTIGVDVVTDDFEGGGTIADGCVEVRGDVRQSFEDEDIDLPEGPICQEDIETILEDVIGGDGDLGMGLGGFGMGLGGVGDLGLGDGEAPTLGITVVQVGGKWFVAPFGTVADVGIAVLEALEREDLDAMVDAVEDLFGGFSGSVGSGFVPPGMEDFEDGFSFDSEAATEVFEGIGEPIDPAASTDVDAVLRTMLTELMGEPGVADCALAELYATARPDQIQELVDGYQSAIEPSPETQDRLYEAMVACGW